MVQTENLKELYNELLSNFLKIFFLMMYSKFKKKKKTIVVT